MTKGRGVAAPFYLLLALPQGAIQGFITVTLGFILVHHGASVAAVAAIGSVAVLPSTLQFVAGPVIDLTMTPKRWYMLAAAAVAASFLALGVVPATPNGVPLLTVVALFAGISLAVLSACLGPLVGSTAACEQRGAISGWQQAGNLGGGAAGGGVGLWLATTWSLPVASVWMAIGSLLVALPILHVRIERSAREETLADRAAATWASVKDLLRTRSGLLALIFNLVPMGLGVATGLFGAIAIDWHASAALVGIVTGVAGSVASALGCVGGGIVAGRVGSRVTQLATGLGAAVAEVLMALAPHTPFWFAVFVIVNSLMVGGCWAALKAVIYDELGEAGGGTVNGILTSASNVPVVVFTALLGLVQVSYGSNGLLLGEAALGIAAVVGLAMLVRLWPARGAGMPDREAVTVLPAPLPGIAV